MGHEGPVNLFNSRAQNQETHLIADIGHATEPLLITKTIFWFSICLLSVLSNLIRTWARKKNLRYQAFSEVPKVMGNSNIGKGENTHTSSLYFCYTEYRARSWSEGKSLFLAYKSKQGSIHLTISIPFEQHS